MQTDKVKDHLLQGAVSRILQRSERQADLQKLLGTFVDIGIQDEYEADSIFTVLMGDEVEPRRQFIQDNALDVKNLDV